VFYKRWMKIIISAFYSIFTLSPIIGFLMPYGTHLKRISQRIANYWFALLIYAFFVVVIGHLLSLLLRRVLKVMPKDFFKRRKTTATGAIISLVLIAAVSIYGMYNARDIRLTDYSVTVDKSVSNMEKLKVVLIADLHMGYSIGLNHIQKTVDLVNSQNPDIVCIAGDIYDNDYDAIEEPEKMAKILGSMKSTYGTYACWGNHDVNEKILSGFTFDFGGKKQHDERMDNFFKKSNINLLEDEVTLIDNKFYVAGRVDRDKPATENDHKKTPEELLIGLDKTKPIITLYHEPDQLSELAKAGTDLLLCGHTHDGQIFPGNLITKLSWENSCGYLKKGDMHNIVTSGVGVYGPYIRVGTHAEVVSIDVNFK
ncbi:MAG: metallophosphoesterase, partial [Ruminococcus sp.]